MKRKEKHVLQEHDQACSIHPQGWVPIETQCLCGVSVVRKQVAFTPKGGCPLKPVELETKSRTSGSSIHPQGWVPIETSCFLVRPGLKGTGSIHPQGWVPIETILYPSSSTGIPTTVAFTPKGGCPLKLLCWDCGEQSRCL